ncbi:unnamed protein product, partial [Toxocara canis]
MYNWEIACGSYIARNSEESVNFLRKFAEYENKLPNSFHGRDNGTIHFYLFENATERVPAIIRKCHSLWQRSKGFSDLFAAEACIRILLSQNIRLIPRIKIMRKGEAWVRDAFLTRGMWSWKSDFMLHGLKHQSLVTGNL